MKKYFIIVSIFSFFILFYGCEKNRNEIKLGVLMPLTGKAASLGKPAFNGIDLAVREFNKNNKNVSITIISEDTKAEPSFAVSAINKLITQNKIKIIIGPLTSTVTLAIAPIAEKNKVIIMSPGASAPKITSAGDYIFRNELSDLKGGEIQAIIAYKRLNFRKIASVYINTDYGVGINSVFDSIFIKLGGEIRLAEAFSAGETNFRTIISKIKTKKVDAVFLVGIDEMINFIEQAKELSLNKPIYTTPIFENESYLKRLGSLAEGIIYVYYGTFDPSSDNKLIKTFVEKYKKEFMKNPTYYSALAYDATKIILKSLKLSNYKLKNVKENLYKIKKFKGITGLTTFDKFGDVSKPVILKTVKNGKFVLYKKEK